MAYLVELTERELPNDHGIVFALAFPGEAPTMYRPAEAFLVLKGHVSTPNLTVRIRGHLGRDIEQAIATVEDLRKLWRGWYSQAIQARAALLRQRVEWPLG